MAWAISAISPRMRSTVSLSAAAKAAHFLSILRRAVEPAVVELVAHVAFEEGAARHVVALGEAQHLPAKRGQAAVVAVELVDQIFDLGGVELDALDLGGELLAQLLVLLLVAGGKVGAGASASMRALLDLGEFLVERGDRGELLERLRLERLLHLGEGEGVVLILFLDRALGAALDHESRRPRRRAASSATSSSSLIDGPAVFSLISPSASSPSSAAVICSGGRALGQHRLEVEDFAQLHAAVVERVGPVDDRVEGDRAFAQAPDHDVAAGLDALGDGDLALAAEQFDRAHLAQVHADRIVGAVGRLPSWSRRPGAGRRRRADRPPLRAPSRRPRRRASSFSTTLIAHVRSADMTSSICSDVIWSWGRASLSSSIGDDAALLGARDQLLDRGVVEVDQRRIAASSVSVSVVSFFAIWLSSPLSRCRPSDASLSLIFLPRRDQPLLFLEGLVAEVPLQPLGGIGQRGVDLDRRPRASRPRSARSLRAHVRVAVAAGEGKTDPPPREASAHAAAASSACQYGGEAVAIKRGAGEGGVDQLVAQAGGAGVGDRQRGERLAMARDACGKLAKPRISARAVARSIPPAPIARAAVRWRAGRGARIAGAALCQACAGRTARRRRRAGAPRCGRTARRSARATGRGRAARRLGSAIAGHGRSGAGQARAGLGRVSGAASTSCRHSRSSSGSGSASSASIAASPARLDDIVGILARRAARRSAGCVGGDVGQGAQRGADRRLRPALSPSKHRIGAGSSRHIRSSWASVTAVPLGATTSAMPARSSPMTSI